MAGKAGESKGKSPPAGRRKKDSGIFQPVSIYKYKLYKYIRFLPFSSIFPLFFPVFQKNIQKIAKRYCFFSESLLIYYI
ncbi:hypothetical protein CLOM621_05897 [Clostridium sp. M62/1]|nr:hypothetical protein CLOM621_05897 [Clostridium sp. M62/1]